MEGGAVLSGAQLGGVRYRKLPPEGGWGYLVMIALAIVIISTLQPMTGFGLVYGGFLKSIGDETTGTTMANGIFNTVFNFTGLAANSLLQRYSFRVVAFLGSIIFFLGAISIVFVQSLLQLIVSYGIIQGLGMGLLFPAFFTALNSYFDKRLNLMNSVSQSLMVAAAMAFPIIIEKLMETYMFRGTVAILAAISLHTFVASAIIQPAEWHMRKVPIDGGAAELNNAVEMQPHLKPLLEASAKEETMEMEMYLTKPRASIISIGDRAISVTTINRSGKKKKNEGFLKTFAKSFDLSLFKQPTYINIAVGLSLSFTSDMAFIAIIPMLLKDSGCSSADVALMMTAFFGSDLTARILFSVVCAIWRLNNRYVFLGGSLISAIFRIAFVMGDSFIWKLATISALGFLRCFIQTPLPSVISDQYSENFASAFSLYMVVCGFVSLAFGPLQSWVKSSTGSDVMVVHLLTLAYLICCVSWTVELVFKRTKTKPQTNDSE